jgi:hypothetical protein
VARWATGMKKLIFEEKKEAKSDLREKVNIRLHDEPCLFYLLFSHSFPFRIGLTRQDSKTAKQVVSGPSLM